VSPIVGRIDQPGGQAISVPEPGTELASETCPSCHKKQLKGTSRLIGNQVLLVERE
jgi:hypothetical protein